ncbi:hypothetical protein JCM8547_009096 [Rhodosporidiobolus lusitaniae]
MFLLHLLSYLACALGGLFVLLSLASGLLYVAEVIEEHSALAKTCGQYLIYAEVLLYLLLFFVDGLPVHIVVVGILAHLVYLGNFSRSWPIISLTSLTFIASCLLVLVHHFLSFRHFSARSASSAHQNRYTHYNAYNRNHTSARDEPTFLDIATFFTVCVWLVPFYLFLSLSANDNVLPSAGEAPSASSAKATSSSSARPPGVGVHPASPALSTSSAMSASSSARGHTRQRSSMMKSALSSAFSIVPSSLRPSTLSTQLPLLQSHNNPGAPRNDLPRSPSPTYGFRPYKHDAPFASASGLSLHSSLPASIGSQLSPQKKAYPPPPLSPSATTGLGFGGTPPLPSPGVGGNRERGSGGALGSPSLGRTLNFSPNPSPSSATFPSSNSPYALPGVGGGGGGGGGTGGGMRAPGMERRHTTERAEPHPPAGRPGYGPERRASEAVVSGMGGGGGGGPGMLKRRGTGM